MATNKDVEKSKPSYTAGGKIAGTETVWHFLKQLNTELPYGSGIPLRYLPREMETHVPTNICMRMFIAALFITTKMWEQPKCPSVDEWINNMCDSHGRILFSDTKEMLNID